MRISFFLFFFNCLFLSIEWQIRQSNRVLTVTFSIPFAAALHFSLMILWLMNRQRKPHAVSMSKTRSGKRLPVLHLQKTPLLHSRIHWLLNFQM